MKQVKRPLCTLIGVFGVNFASTASAAPGPPGPPAAPAGDEVIFDNIGPNGSFLFGPGGAFGFANMEFLSTYCPAVTVDDFELTQPMNLTSVETMVGSFPGQPVGNFQNIIGYRVEIYSSPQAALQDIDGDVASVFFDEPHFGTVGGAPFTFFGGNPVHHVGFNLDIDLPTGTYWVDVIPVNVWQTNGITVSFGSLEGEYAEPLQVHVGCGEIASLPAAGVGFKLLGQPAVTGDLDGDGVVGPGDLATLLGRWGACPLPPGACIADIDGDGVVGPTDLAILLGNWG